MASQDGGATRTLEPFTATAIMTWELFSFLSRPAAAVERPNVHHRPCKVCESLDPRRPSRHTRAIEKAVVRHVRAGRRATLQAADQTLAFASWSWPRRQTARADTMEERSLQKPAGPGHGQSPKARALGAPPGRARAVPSRSRLLHGARMRAGGGSQLTSQRDTIGPCISLARAPLKGAPVSALAAGAGLRSRLLVRQARRFASQRSFWRRFFASGPHK